MKDCKKYKNDKKYKENKDLNVTLGIKGKQKRIKTSRGKQK